MTLPRNERAPGIPAAAFWLLAAIGLGAAIALLPQDGSIIGMALAALAVLAAAALILPALLTGMSDRFLLTVLTVAVVAKVVGTLARLYFTFNVYSAGDSEGYHRTGVIISELLRSGQFSQAWDQYFDVGTTFLVFVTGVVYALIGPTLVGGYIFFSFLAFVGAAFFYKAFRMASPSGNWRLFAVLIFLYPALLYWPSGIGKDAVIFLFGGIVTYGAALLLARGSWIGLVPVTLGLGGAFLVRPHVALILAGGVAVAMLVRIPGRSVAAFGTHVAVAVIVFTGAWIVGMQTADQFGLESLSPSAVTDYLVEQESNPFRFSDNESNFTVPLVTDPIWAPAAFVNVLFRPFPWEAHNGQALLQSLDGVLMALLIGWGLWRIGRNLRHMFSRPFMVYTVATMTVLILAVSTLGNFGLLARQRAMVIPFVFIAIAASPLPRRADESDEGEDVVADAGGRHYRDEAYPTNRVNGALPDRNGAAAVPRKRYVRH